MPQISSLRLLFSSANHHALLTSPLTPKPPLSLSHLFKIKHPFLHTYTHKPRRLLFAAYSRKPKNIERPGSLSGSRRRSSSSSKTENKGKSAMEESSSSAIAESVGFNKRRAEGKDKNDGPRKNLQLKVRKLNPVNTISYVQILGTGMDTQDTTPSVLLFFDKQRFIFNAGEVSMLYCRIQIQCVWHLVSLLFQMT
uniref:Putative ovule protein n=1 Tax=Solanum chacoense TaxID=4108 RepID=A0A0V0H780_SOLCH